MEIGFRYWRNPVRGNNKEINTSGEKMNSAISKLVFSIFLFSTVAAASSDDWVNPSNSDLTVILKGKRISASHVRGGQVSLQFRDDGTLYGNHSSGGADSGKWKIEESKLCMNWRQWEYEGCGLIQQRGSEYRHLYPNGSLHLSFRVN